MRSVTPLMETCVPKMSFRPSASKPSIEVAGEIIWKGESNTMVGVRFVELPKESHMQVREWMELESAPIPASSDRARYSFEPPLPRRTPAQNPSLDTLASPSKPAAAQSVIPIRIPDPGSENSTALIAAPSIVSIESQESESVLTSEEAPLSQSEVWKQRPHRTAVLVALFAAVSLAAGWFVGRSMLNRSSAKIQSLADDDRTAASPAPGAAAGSFSIEVIDSNDHRWVVPYSGSSSASVGQFRQYSQPPPNPNAQPSQTNLPLRIWMPSAPIVSRNSSAEQQKNPTLAASAPNIDAKEPPSPAPILRNASPDLPARVAHESSGYRDGQLIHRVDPIYPDLARSLNVEGVVKLRLEVAADGKVSHVQVLSSPKLLLQAAVAAVRQWRYQPALLDGKPTEVEKEIDVQFHLPK